MDTSSTRSSGRNTHPSKLGQLELHFESIGSIKDERDRLKRQASRG